MSRSSSFAVFITMLVAFVVVASHLGMIDHSAMDPMAASAPAAGLPTSGMANATAIPVAAPSMLAHNPRPAHSHGSGMTMIMICDVMVLVSALGIVLLQVVTSLRVQWTATARVRMAGLFPRPVLSAGRPPGLSMLCVVRC